MYHELSPKEQKLLGAIKTINDIKSVVVVDEWEDDHLPCVGVKINKIPISFWWLNGSGVGALHYADESPRARKLVLDMLKEQIQISLENEDDPDFVGPR